MLSELPQPQQRELSFSPENLQWVVSGYALAFGGFLMLGGRAADLLGRRRVFISGLGLFTLASLMGGVAQDRWVLVAARALQGLGGALAFPAALSLLTTTFNEANERSQALAIWGAMAAGGFSVGVLLGGILTDVLNWRWVMFVNVPIGAIAIILSPIVLDESRQGTKNQQIDLAGAVLITAGLVLLVYALVQAPEVGWLAPLTIYLLVSAIAILTLFVFVESRAKYPLIPLNFFRQHQLIAANIGAALFNAIVTSTIFILTIYMQQVLGYTALQTGLAFLPYSIASIVAAPVAGRSILHWGIRRTLMSGMTELLVGMLLLSRIPVEGNFVRDLLLGTTIL